MGEFAVASSANVTRETVKRRYHSPARLKKGERARLALIEATLDIMLAGNFRPKAEAIAAAVNLWPSAVTHYFGALHLLCRIVARAHWQPIAASIGLGVLPEREQQRLVWLMLVGTTSDDYPAR